MRSHSLIAAIVSILLGSACASHRATNGGALAGQPVLARTIPLPGVGGPVERNGIAGRLDHAGYDPGTQRLFLAGFSKGSLEAIDLKEGRLVHTFDGVPEAQGVVVIPDLHRVYVAAGGDGTLHCYDTRTLAPLGVEVVIEDADNVRYDAQSDRVVVGGGSATLGGLVWVDPGTLKVTSKIDLPSHAESFQLDPRSGRVWANVPWDKNSDRDGIVVVADRATSTTTATWHLREAARNFPMVLDVSRDRVFIITRKPHQILLFKASTGDLLHTEPCVADCDDAFWDELSRRLFLIGGGRRVSDHAGAPISQDQLGALDTFSVADDGAFTHVGSQPLPSHTRTGLFVPERGAIYVAVPIQPGKDAELREYKIR